MFALVFTTLFCVLVLPLNEHIAFSSPSPANHLLPYALKALFAVILYNLCCFFFDFVGKLKSGDAFYRRWAIFTSIYLAIMLLIFIVIYPGNWVWDEYHILEPAKHYGTFSWENYFTNIWYTMCLYLIPTAVAIVAAQVTFVSFVVGYVMAGAHKLLRKKALVWIIFLFFLLPPVILNNFYPLRTTMCAFIELLLISRLLFTYLGVQKVRNKFREFVGLTVLITLISLWRTEAVYYLLLLPVVAFRLKLVSKKSLQQARTYIYAGLAAIILATGAFITSTTHDVRYEVTALVNPLSNMVNHPLKGTRINDRLNQINQVLSIQVLQQYPSYYDIPAYWNGAVQPGFETHMAAFKKQFVYLVLHNPVLFLEARMVTFLSTNGFGVSSGLPVPPPDMPTMAHDIEQFQHDNLASTPINEGLRSNVIRGLTLTAPRQPFGLWGHIIWDSIPAMVALFALGVIKLLRREYFWAILAGFVLLRAPLLFLTAPANYFMYYLPIYIVGYFMVLLAAVQNFDRHFFDAKVRAGRPI